MLTQDTEHQTLRSVDEGRARFLEWLPSIEVRLRGAFCHLNPDAREEAVQEGVANCYCAYERLRRQGRSERALASTLAWYAIRHIRAGRQVGCRLNSRDPLSRYAQQRNGIRPIRLDRRSAETGDWLRALVEDRRTPIPDQVALRIDVPAWLGTLTRSIRSIADDLAVGLSTSDVASKHRLSAGRISQIRTELYMSWHHFHGLKIATEAAVR